ncbi:MAG: response regulator transcription factor [Dorea sp.]|nr:response regulator transcription factor [Dorea sp.]
MNILVVEDDEIIRQELLLLLKNALYDVTALERFDDVASKILMKDYDLVLLDLNLPYESGFDICTKVRKESDVPVIFLTGRTDSADELDGMLKGGDDYITKPFHSPVLLARIAAVLKRTKRGTDKEISVLAYKDVKLHLAKGCVSYQGKSAELSKNEMKILHCLFLRQGEIVSRADLIEYLWDDQVFIDDNSLSVNMTRLRNKLEDIGVHDFIETKRRMGYRI